MRFLLLLFLGFLLTPSISQAQAASINGSMPKNGASGLLRNVVISVGLKFSSPQIGIDPGTLSHQTVRIFQKNFPNQFIDVFLLADDYMQSLVVEPIQLLEPQTEYVFEITPQLRDLAGNSFGPYRIEFTTGEKSISKSSRGERPRILHNSKKQYLPPHSQIASVEVPHEKEPLVASSENADEKLDSVNTVPQTEPPSEALAEVEVDKDGLPAPAIGLENEPGQSIEEEESLSATTMARFSFPKTEIAQNGRLPLILALPEKAEVKYIIKNTSGQVVREGSAKFKAGEHKKSLSLGDLDSGRYLILIKGGTGKARHIFEIK